ncbi:hypothetical protein GGQ63_002262 [Prosthecomicrobium pneumaticum]|uniref:Uncharacterized protein n=1 Tax=Prosthecomicrobium pneumaticum TaxID=81895 RepID=A0A7W9FM70_9HYPH|nr:hypothetical protein [Prosthecomicrobium pneumaticum]
MSVSARAIGLSDGFGAMGRLVARGEDRAEGKTLGTALSRGRQSEASGLALSGRAAGGHWVKPLLPHAGEGRGEGLRTC